MINSIIPTVPTQTAHGPYYTDLISKLTNDRIILLSGPVNSTSASIIVAQLLFLESQNPNADINIYINSPGGSVSDGLALYDTMKHIKCDVNTICIGMAASMGAFLLSAGTKGKRYILPNAEVMIHQPLGGVSGQASDIEICAQHILKTKEKLNCLLAQNCNQDISTISQATDRDNWLSAQEAVTFGIVDKILN